MRLRLEAAQAVIAAYEKKYGLPFNKFQEAWQAGRITAKYSYAVEGDYWNWEAAVSETGALQELSESMA